MDYLTLLVQTKQKYMKPIIDYMVVSAITESQITGFVKIHMNTGWVPFGSISVAYGEINTLPGTLNNERKPGFLFTQALIKY